MILTIAAEGFAPSPTPTRTSRPFLFFDSNMVGPHVTLYLACLGGKQRQRCWCELCSAVTQRCSSWKHARNDVVCSTSHVQQHRRASRNTHTRDPNQPTTYLTRFRKEPQEEQVRMQEALGRNGLQRHCACSIEIASRFTGSGQQNTRS